MIDSSSGFFRRHSAILKMFKIGRKHRVEVKRGECRVCGAVFDADGDRFYMIEYEPFSDRLIVLSGDETAVHQMNYLKNQFL